MLSYSFQIHLQVLLSIPFITGFPIHLKYNYMFSYPFEIWLQVFSSIQNLITASPVHPIYTFTDILIYPKFIYRFYPSQIQ